MAKPHKGAPNVAVALDDQDRALLLALADFERLTKSDIVRRAIRHYAKALGVTAEPAQGAS